MKLDGSAERKCGLTECPAVSGFAESRTECQVATYTLAHHPTHPNNLLPVAPSARSNSGLQTGIAQAYTPVGKLGWI